MKLFKKRMPKKFNKKVKLPPRKGIFQDEEFTKIIENQPGSLQRFKKQLKKNFERSWEMVEDYSKDKKKKKEMSEILEQISEFIEEFEEYIQKFLKKIENETDKAFEELNKKCYNFVEEYDYINEKLLMFDFEKTNYLNTFEIKSKSNENEIQEWDDYEEELLEVMNSLDELTEEETKKEEVEELINPVEVSANFQALIESIRSYTRHLLLMILYYNKVVTKLEKIEKNQNFQNLKQFFYKPERMNLKSRLERVIKLKTKLQDMNT